MKCFIIGILITLSLSACAKPDPCVRECRASHIEQKWFTVMIGKVPSQRVEDVAVCDIWGPYQQNERSEEKCTKIAPPTPGPAELNQPAAKNPDCWNKGSLQSQLKQIDDILHTPNEPDEVTKH